MDQVLGAKLEDLNRDLSESTNRTFPEEYVKRTLLAHGFLAHHRIFQEHKRKSEESDKFLTDEGITEAEKKRTTQLVYHFKEGKEEPLNLIRRHQLLLQKASPLWPAEVDCISYRCNFLWDVPASPEPFYTPDAPVLSPKIRSSLGEGTIVYSNTRGPEKYFTKSRQGPNLSVPHRRQRQHGNTNLIFESRFESGNLAKAIQVGRWDYELYLRFDLYTQKHTQWFYFNVQNMRAGQTYRFTIVNLYKPSSLYNGGMQPLMYSEKKAEWNHTGWRRVGFNIKYFKTDMRRLDTSNEHNYYALTWSYTFPFDNDVCYFAHCYPYTYTDLQEHLHSIATDPVKSKFCKQRTLCHTIAGNPVPLLTITSPSSTPEEAQTKKAVVVTARVHPGETNSSWMMKGLINLLTSESPDAEILRDAFVFKIIPMLNPDGVIVGNYRCSLTGRDLNRNYRTKLPDAYPTVWYAKQFIKKLSEERKIAIYCDLHGHSRKQNVFIYGCDNVQDPKTRFHSRVFPTMLSRNAPDKFCYKSCNFKVQKTKEGTGRVYMWREMGILNSYTMEATFCGSNLKQTGHHFSTKDLEDIGYHFCDTLLDYFDPDQSKCERILSELVEDYRQTLISKLTALGVEIPPGVDPLDIQFDFDIYSDLIDSSDTGSDSSDSDGPPVLGKYHSKKRKNKKLQSRKERNKQKARIKLTHKLNQQTSQQSTKQTQLINEDSKKMVDITSNVIKDKSSNDSMTTDISRNESEKVDSKEHPIEIEDKKAATKYIETVTADYMRNGLPHNISLDANKELASSTASFLSNKPARSQCLIAIMPKVLQDPSQSKIGSKSTLPQLPLETTVAPISTKSTSLVTSSNGTFARNYVVNHIKDPTEDTRANGQMGNSFVRSTKNLVGLSKLFRQLKPHIQVCSQNQEEPKNFDNHDGYYNNNDDGGLISSSSTQSTLSSLSGSNSQCKMVEEQPKASAYCRSMKKEDLKSLNKLLPQKNKLVSLPARPVSTTRLPIAKSSSTGSTAPVPMNTIQEKLYRETNQRILTQESGTKEVSNKTDKELSLLHLSQPPVAALEWPIVEDDVTSVVHHNKNFDASNYEYKREKRQDNDPSFLKNHRNASHKKEISDAVEALKQRKKRLFKSSFTNISQIPNSQTNSTYIRPQTSSAMFPQQPQTNFNHPQTKFSPQIIFKSDQPHHANSYSQNSNSEPHTTLGSDGRKSRLHYNNADSQYRMYSTKHTSRNSSSSNHGIIPATVSLTLSSTKQDPQTVSKSSPKPLQLRYYFNQHRVLY